MLELRNINKSFDEKVLFNNFSYSFNDSGIYALVGTSGIGKTTLLRMISGLDKDYDGDIVGGDIGNVSYAFQEHRLFPQLSTLDNVVFAISTGKDEAVVKNAKNELLSLGFTEADMQLFPSELSGGMRQRVSLARAFLKDAPILLLDEPTKELDAINASLVKQKILENSKNRLVIMVTHNPLDVTDLGAEIIIL